MKVKILLLFVSVLLIATGIAKASVSVNETTSAQDLVKHGHSDKLIESVRISKCGATGQECLTDDEYKYQNASKPVKWVRKFFIYFDPALDNDAPMMHNIKNTPSVNDL